MNVPELSYVSTYDHDGVAVLVPVGDFDIASLHLFRDPLIEASTAGNRVILEMSGTTFVDSTVLGAITAAVKRTREAGGWLRIVSPRPNVRRVLRLMALDTIIGLYDSVAEAAADPDGIAAPPEAVAT